MTLSYLALAQSVAFLFFALWALYMDRLSALHQVYAGLALFSAWWSFCYTFLYIAKTSDAAWLWYRLSAVGWCGSIIAALFFSMLFADETCKVPAWLKIGAPLFMLSLIVIQVFNSLFVVGFSPTRWGMAEIIDIGRPGFWYFILPLAGLIGSSIGIYAHSRRNNPMRRVRVRSAYSLLLVLLIYPLGFSLNIFLPLIHRGGFPSLGVFGMSIYLLVSLWLMHQYRTASLETLHITLVEALDDRMALLSPDYYIIKMNRVPESGQSPIGTHATCLFADPDPLRRALEESSLSPHAVGFRGRAIEGARTVPVQGQVRCLVSRHGDIEGYTLLIKTVPDFQLLADKYRLSAQERILVQHSAQGLAVKEIAAIMKLSSGTVKNYLATVYRKTGARSQVDLVRLFLSQL